MANNDVIRSWSLVGSTQPALEAIEILFTFTVTRPDTATFFTTKVFTRKNPCQPDQKV